MDTATFLEKILPIVKEVSGPYLLHADENWAYIQIGDHYLSNESFDLIVFEAMLNISAEDYL